METLLVTLRKLGYEKGTTEESLADCCYVSDANPVVTYNLDRKIPVNTARITLLGWLLKQLDGETDDIREIVEQIRAIYPTASEHLILVGSEEPDSLTILQMLADLVVQARHDCYDDASLLAYSDKLMGHVCQN